MQLLDALQPPAQPQAAPDRICGDRLRWENADDQTGTVRDRRHLHDLIALTGGSSAWNWVRIVDAVDESFAQVCGHAETGLIVELSKPGAPDLITHRAAQLSPRTNVGAPGWRYLAHREELLPLDEIIDIVTDWLLDRHLDRTRYERRSIAGRDARRINDDEAHG